MTMGSRYGFKWWLLTFVLVILVSGCSDRLSSTYPEMKAFVTNAGFEQQPQVPVPTNLGPTAPWCGMATKSGLEFIVIIYPTTRKLYTVRLGVRGRLTRSQMIQRLTNKGLQKVDKRLRLDGQTVNDEHTISLYWVYMDEKGFPTQYFDLQGIQMDMKAPHPEIVFSFEG